MMGLPTPLAIVAHDAGAANIILAWISEHDLPSLRPVMQGPALALWRARFGDASLFVTSEEALDGAAALLSGTGWASKVEHDARRAAVARTLPSIAVIDHWVNYRERFRRDGEELLPSSLWVTDHYAVTEARRTMPEVPVIEQPNLYLRRQVEAAGPRPVNGDLLFVSEPARDDWGKGVAGEFQTLDYLVAGRAAAGVDTTAPLRIRPHPSDSSAKYDTWISEHPGSRLDTSPDLAQALRDASWVAGLQSFALVVAMEAGRPAICALPPAAPKCRLPHTGLIHLRHALDAGAKSPGL